jgi:hypothetical protein
VGFYPVRRWWLQARPLRRGGTRSLAGRTRQSTFGPPSPRCISACAGREGSPLGIGRRLILILDNSGIAYSAHRLAGASLYLIFRYTQYCIRLDKKLVYRAVSLSANDGIPILDSRTPRNVRGKRSEDARDRGEDYMTTPRPRTSRSEQRSYLFTNAQRLYKTTYPGLDWSGTVEQSPVAVRSGRTAHSTQRQACQCFLREQRRRTMFTVQRSATASVLTVYCAEVKQCKVG